MKVEMKWYPVPGQKLPGAAQMVLLFTPLFEGGYCGITYGWKGVDGKWYHNNALGASEILRWIGNGKYESAVEGWMPMPPKPEWKSELAECPDCAGQGTNHKPECLHRV